MIDRTTRQKEAIEKWIANKCNGYFNFCTGFGKSYTAVMAIERFFAKNPTKRVLIIVPTEVLQRQWISNLAKEGLVFNIDVFVEKISSANSPNTLAIMTFLTRPRENLKKPFSRSSIFGFLFCADKSLEKALNLTIGPAKIFGKNKMKII